MSSGAEASLLNAAVWYQQASCPNKKSMTKRGTGRPEGNSTMRQMPPYGVLQYSGELASAELSMVDVAWRSRLAFPSSAAAIRS
jgi:hypothetical protein